MERVKVRVRGPEGTTLLVNNLRRGPLSPTAKAVVVSVTPGVTFRARTADGTIVKEVVRDITADSADSLIDLLSTEAAVPATEGSSTDDPRP